MLVAYFYLTRFAFDALNRGAGRCGTPCMFLCLQLTINIDLKMACTFDVNNKLAILLGHVGCLVLSREVSNTYSWCKLVHTIGSDSQRILVILCSDRTTRHLGIIPECATQSFLAIDGTYGHQTLEHLIISKITTF